METKQNYIISKTEQAAMEARAAKVTASFSAVSSAKATEDIQELRQVIDRK